MKSTTVETITSNEQHVRMRIFDGDLPANEAYQALLELEHSQRKAEWDHHLAYARGMMGVVERMQEKIRQLEEALASG